MAMVRRIGQLASEIEGGGEVEPKQTVKVRAAKRGTDDDVDRPVVMEGAD